MEKKAAAKSKDVESKPKQAAPARGGADSKRSAAGGESKSRPSSKK